MNSRTSLGSTTSATRQTFKRRIRNLWANLSKTLKPQESNSLLAPVEILEDRVLLSAILPVFVDGEFSFGNPEFDAPYGLQNTFKLESNPGAAKTIFLDFDGHHSVDNQWGHDIIFDAFDTNGDVDNFSNAELIEIQKQFQNVAEDFFPFNVNVTTIDPGLDALLNTGDGDTEWGVRSLATQAKDGFGNGIGGVAFVGFFGSPDSVSDAPAFTFNKGVNNGAMTHSHEVGHTLGLSHDGLNGQAYHPGSGTGDTSWGPIMGAPFGNEIVHWSKGEYIGATTNQDDLAIITNTPSNGFGYRADDHGDGINVATDLNVDNNTEASGWGIIGRTLDEDYFRFTTGEGNINFTISPFQENPNLDIEAKLFNADGTIVATSNPVNGLGASFDVNLLSGDYYISIDGIGKTAEYTEYGSLGFYSIVGDIQEPVDPPPNVIGETGMVDIQHIWTTVELDSFYVDPVIIASVNSSNDSDPLTLRIRNVTGSTFEIQIDEWDYQQRYHEIESVSYMVMESGIHLLDNGMTVFAGNASVNHNWINVGFSEVLDSSPVVFAQTTTRNGGAAVTTRIDDVTLEGFKLRLQEEEKADGTHAFETVGWIAFDVGLGTIGESEFDTDIVTSVGHKDSFFAFNDPFDSAPALFANMQTYNGSNTATVRISDHNSIGATINVEEERSLDGEIRHIGEDVGYLAIDVGAIFGESRIGEAGTVGGLDGSWKVVNLIQTYENPVVVAGLLSLNDASESNVRIRNVTSSSFEIHVDEWDYLDRNHDTETVGYFVVEAGIHKLADGTFITANNSNINHNWAGVDYGYDFDDTPVVFSQTTTYNGRSAVTTRMDDVGLDGFQLKLQEEEKADGTHSFETVSWIAMDEGISGSDGFGYQSLLFDELTHEESSINFSRIFAQKPIVIGGIQTYQDGDTATIRQTEDGIERFSVKAFLEEERSKDAEIEHGPEQVGILALDRGRIPGVTVDFFSGPLTGQGRSAFTAQASYQMAVVPRVTYIDNGPVIAETAMDFGHAEDFIGRGLDGNIYVGQGLHEVAFAVDGSNSTSPIDGRNEVIDPSYTPVVSADIQSNQDFEFEPHRDEPDLGILTASNEQDSRLNEELEQTGREIKHRMEDILG